MPTVSADGRTVTIRVRPGYRFSPGPLGGGTPVTAETFRYTIERTFSRQGHSGWDRVPPAAATRRRPRLREWEHAAGWPE